LLLVNLRVLFLKFSSSSIASSYFPLFLLLNSLYLQYEPFIAEIPYLIDTLILNKDYSFRSGHYGEGSFELKENRIKLIYKYEFGSSSYEAPIETDSDGNPKIILFQEHNHHYKKIK